MPLSLIAAMDRNRLIGRDNALPWHLPADLRHFKAVTMGKPILMGRRTWESIGWPLPGRRNLVLTRDPAYTAEGCDVVHSVDEALALTADAEELMVIGGARLYEQTLPRAERLYLTLIDDEFPGDTWFPEWDAAAWREVARERHEADERNPHGYSFVILERVA